MKRKEWTTAELRKARDAYRKGGYKLACHVTGRTAHAVRAKACAEGWKSSIVSRPWTTTEVAKLIDGGDPLEIAAKLDRPVRRVKQKAKSLGIRLAHQVKSDRWPEDVKKRAHEMRDKGWTLCRISAHLGVSEGTLRHWIYDHVQFKRGA